MNRMHFAGSFRLFSWLQFLLLLLFIPDYSFSQQAGNVKNEIVVLIDKETMEFPTVSGEIMPDRLNLRSSSLRSVFDRFRVANIRKAFPEFAEGDSVRILKDGRTVSIPRFSRIFVLTVPQEADVDSTIA